MTRKALRGALVKNVGDIDQRHGESRCNSCPISLLKKQLGYLSQRIGFLRSSGGTKPPCLYLLKGFSMLVLSRRPNEVIRIGDDIKITVTKLRDGRAWIGVDAPKHIKVVREEIRLAINTEATATDSDCD